MGKRTGRDSEPKDDRATGRRVTTDNLPTCPAVMSTEGVLAEVLLAVGTSRDICIILPRDYTLLKCLLRVALDPVQRPPLVLRRLGDFLCRIRK